MASVSSPHDRFFKYALSDQRVAKAFFEFHLPDTIREVIDLNSLQLRKESFIDQELQLAITDMLFAVNWADKPGYIYLLAEHQSSPDRWMPFRLLKYMLQIMDRHLKESQSVYLPLIYPLVFYHGEARYNYSRDILDLFEEPILAKSILFKPFQLVDVNQIPDETLKQQVWLGVVELCFKHIFARDILPYIKDLLEPLQILEEMDGKGIIKSALTYLMSAGEISNKEAFIEIIQTGLSPEVGDNIMTIAQQLKAEAITERNKSFVDNCLKQGLALETISKLTELSIEEIKALKETSMN